ncbi:MAG TPA: hypothetical protein VG245_10700 [Candidatus Dormibacteraeota bacterium]|nr:hypothetical protein [Candidatus Dormibacteraeota bacterium]
MSGSLALPAPPTKAHCQLDNWDFDPRYTDGACPICGWRPAGARTTARPSWLAWADRVEWDLVGLVALFVVLLVMGVLVGQAAGLSLFPK